MLDDENTVDADHDDMIVRMSVSAVPEPGTLALAILGAGSVALTVRRRRRGRTG
jgi:ABC-type transport system involved in cytochrome c biogenesis permease component